MRDSSVSSGCSAGQQNERADGPPLARSTRSGPRACRGALARGHNPNKTSFESILRWAWTACVAAGLTIAACAAERRPNIVLIVSDDHGYSDLGIIGVKPILTPHLDRLAREGVRATSFYTTWSACTPSRASMLTGRYPLRNGLYTNVRNDMVNYKHHFTPEEYAVSPEMTLGLDPKEITIGNVLQSAGYRTGVVGKWDMGQAKRYLPLQRGFDSFHGIGNNGIEYYTHERYGVPSMFRGNQRTEADKGTYATDVFKREALQFIRQNRERPFFLYVAFNAPHGASDFVNRGPQAPQEFIERYPTMDPKSSITRFYAAVTAMDAAIGELRAALEEHGLAKNTLIVFLSDNGGTGNGGNAPLRGAKSTLWEGGIRVPFIAWWPGRLPAGRVADDFLTALELFPTFASIAGARLPKDVILDGFDLLPVLQDTMKSPRNEMYWVGRRDGAARVGTWKWHSSRTAGGLYDLERDPGETKDLSAQRPDVVAMFEKKYAAFKKQMDEAEPRGPFRDY